MPRPPDEHNPARIALPPELAEVLAGYERRIMALERDLAELQRAPWAADIAAVRNAIPTWATLSGKPVTFPPSLHTHDWSDVTGKPTTFTPGNHTHPWDDVNNGVTGKPTTFTPSSHNHSWADITSGTQPAPVAHNHSWADITSGTQPAPVAHGNERHTSTFITGVAWTDITSKPTSFWPSNHSHDFKDYAAAGETNWTWQLTWYVPKP